MSVELTLACNLMAKFEAANEGVNLEPVIALGAIQAYAAIAQIDAAFAQVRALERIAASLEIYLNDYDPNSNEARGVTTEDIGY